MKDSQKPAGIDFLQKYEICKEKMLTAYLKDFRKNGGSEKAFDAAKKTLIYCLEKWKIKNKNQILGLYGELIYFNKRFQDQDLTAEMAIGLRSDFRGKVLGRPAAIDVTTNPAYKVKEDFAQIPGCLKNGWDYYLGVVDVNHVESELFPLLLPLCKDDEVGFFVMVIDSTTPSSANLWGENADTQYIIRYNPNCDGDELDAIEGICCEYNYILSKPSEVVRDIQNSYADWGVEMRGTKEFRKKLRQDTERHFSDLVLEFAKLSGIMISAVVGLDEQWYWKDDVDYVSRQYWVHPHKYTLKKLGKPGEIMDFNIAAHLHDYPLSFKHR